LIADDRGLVLSPLMGYDVFTDRGRLVNHEQAVYACARGEGD